MKERVVFVDLDGTLIGTKSGEIFPKGVWDMVLNFELLDALKAYKPLRVFIVSNQGGIEKGFVSLSGFVCKLNYIEKCVEEYCGCKCEGSFCSSNNKENRMRKPNCGMLDDFYHDYTHNNDFAKRNAIMVGDASGKDGQFSDSDKKCAENFGIKYYDVEDFINEFGRNQ